jgi:phage terminase small subunit
MAGVKGRSGGARAGAGRKKNPENEGAEYSASTEGMSPLDALEHFQNDPAVPVALRIKAAGLAAPFKHKKLGEGSKPQAGKPEAEEPGTGRYATRKGPGAAVKH